MEEILIAQFTLSFVLLLVATLVIDGAKFVSPKHKDTIGIITIVIVTVMIIGIDIHAQQLLMGMEEYMEY